MSGVFLEGDQRTGSEMSLHSGLIHGKVGEPVEWLDMNIREIGEVNPSASREMSSESVILAFLGGDDW